MMLWVVWLHVVLAMIWLGGMIFLAVVVLPIIRRPELAAHKAAIMHMAGVRFRAMGWAGFAVLLITGIAALGGRGFRWSNLADGTIFAGPFGRTLAIKLVLVAVVIALSAVHDFYWGPQATRAAQGGDTVAAERFRRRASLLGRLTAGLALAIVYLAVRLVRGG